MHEMKSVLNELVRSKGMRQNIDARLAIAKWRDVAGAVAYRFSRGVRIKNGRLTVVVSNSALLTDMTFRKKEYVEKYDRILGEGIVKDIEFKIGRIKQAESGGQEENPLVGDIGDIKLSREEIARADQLVAQIEDHEIKERLRRAYIGQMKLDRWRKSRFGG